MTYRERREARADRLRGWADKRETRGTAELDQARKMGDAIPFGQPILVGHHSENRDRRYRDRIHNKTGRGVADLAKAGEMRAKADNIEAAADAAVYSDDHDAAERLRERVAEREAERDRVKAYNASCRKGAPDLSVLDERQRRDIDSITRHASFQLGKGGAFPSYHLSNLGATIRKDQKRLDAMEATP